jgi:hypothetical protein
LTRPCRAGHGAAVFSDSYQNNIINTSPRSLCTAFFFWPDGFLEAFLYRRDFSLIRGQLPCVVRVGVPLIRRTAQANIGPLRPTLVPEPHHPHPCRGEASTTSVRDKHVSLPDRPRPCSPRTQAHIHPFTHTRRRRQNGSHHDQATGPQPRLKQFGPHHGAEKFRTKP